MIRRTIVQFSYNSTMVLYGVGITRYNTQQNDLWKYDGINQLFTIQRQMYYVKSQEDKINMRKRVKIGVCCGYVRDYVHIYNMC